MGLHLQTLLNDTSVSNSRAIFPLMKTISSENNNGRILDAKSTLLLQDHAAEQIDTESNITNSNKLRESKVQRSLEKRSLRRQWVYTCKTLLNNTSVSNSHTIFPLMKTIPSENNNGRILYAKSTFLLQAHTAEQVDTESNITSSNKLRESKVQRSLE